MVKAKGRQYGPSPAPQNYPSSTGSDNVAYQNTGQNQGYAQNQGPSNFTFDTGPKPMEFMPNFSPNAPLEEMIDKISMEGI